jgi:hypothetical protein
MTIRRGQEWGTPGPLAHDGVIVGTDAEASTVVARARRERTDPPELGLLGGDLCRTVGGRGESGRLSTEHAQRLPVDLGVALLDGRVEVFVAHLIVPGLPWAVRSGLDWVRPWIVVMNAAWIGPWQFAPASHPNDGRLEILEGAVPPSDLLAFRRRARSGTHVPHPAIRTRHTDAAQFEFDRPRRVIIDGRPCGRVRNISVRVEPDRLLCVV